MAGKYIWNNHFFINLCNSITFVVNLKSSGNNKMLEKIGDIFIHASQLATK